MNRDNDELRKELLRTRNRINELNTRLDYYEDKLDYKNVLIAFLTVYSLLVSINLWFTF